LTPKRRLAGGRVIEDAAHREDVSAPIDGRAPELLGRHVGELAADLARARRLVELPLRLGHAEAGELRRAVERDEDVLRTDVAVHDAERRALRVRELLARVQARASVRHAPGRDAG